MGVEQFPPLLRGSNKVYTQTTAPGSVQAGDIWIDTSAPYAPLTYRNYIRNGDMTVAQRGTSFGSIIGYTLDGWRLQTGTGATATVNRNVHTLGAFVGPKYYLTMGRTVAGSANTVLWQPMEDVTRFAGKTMTVSFWASASTTISIDVQMAQYFGSGGSPSTQFNTSSQTINLTTANVYYTLTFTLPSISGKTLGTNGDDDGQLIFIYSNAQANGNVNIWDVQVEDGSVATPYERKSQRAEYDNARRYLKRYGNPSVQENLPVWQGGATSLDVYLSVDDMRATPTCTLTNLTDANYQQPSPGAGKWAFLQSGVTWYSKTGTATISPSITPQWAMIQFFGATWGAANQLALGSGTYIDLSAEL